MNKQIKELAEQAEEYALRECDNNGHFHQIYREKFAELIIRECMELVEDYTKTRTHNTHYDADEQIKVNFGVE
jgi:hypothetical protein